MVIQRANRGTEHPDKPTWPFVYIVLILRHVPKCASNTTPVRARKLYFFSAFLPVCNPSVHPSPHVSPKIDVMVLYSEEAWSADESSEGQLLTKIAEGFQTSNAAMVTSMIDLKFNLVHVGEVSAGVELARPKTTSDCASYQVSGPARADGTISDVYTYTC